MKFNLNRPSGILMLIFIRGAIMGAPAGIVNAANGNPIAAALFQILSASCILLAVFFLLINGGEAKKGKQKKGSKMLIPKQRLNS